jgi:ABC-type multidrug transport system fused ATPase/permease subunit
MKPFLICIGLLLVQEVLAIAYPLFLKNTTSLIKNDSGLPPTMQQLLLSAGVVLVLIVAIFCINIYTEYMLSVFAGGVRTNVRRALFNKIQRVPSNKISEFGAGKILATVVNDSTWVKACDRRLVTIIIYIPVTILGSFIIMWTLSPVYFLIAICSLPIALLIFLINSKVLNKIIPKTTSAYDTFFETTRESISGARDIRILGKANERNEESRKHSVIYRKQGRSIDKSIYLSQSVHSVIFSVITAMLIWYGAKYDVDTAVRLVALSTAIQYVNNIWTGYNNLYKWFIDNNTRGKYAYKRIYDIMDLPEEDKESGLKQIDMLSNSSLQFNDVMCETNGGRVALDTLNLSVESGKLMAVSGQAGAGKTILVRLLLRYIDPTRGDITVNGINIRDINKRYYRKEIISHCSAHPSFVPGTIRDNIALFNPNMKDKEIIDVFREIGAAKLADTKGFLDMKISNRSKYGQDIKNVINIVRSIVKPATFYIFNRCFAHINADIIERAVKKLRNEKKTCLFITFNSVVCKTVDEICFIEKGKRTIIAPHKELLNISPKYASFFVHTAPQDAKYDKPEVTESGEVENIGGEQDESFVSSKAV